MLDEPTLAEKVCRELPPIIEAAGQFHDFIQALRAELGCGDDSEEILAAVRRLKDQVTAVRAVVGESA